MLATFVKGSLADGIEIRSSEEIHHVREPMISCLNRGMRILGESGSFAVVHILKSEYGMTMEQCLNDPNRFVSVLRKIFGLGAKVLEKAILEEFYLVITPEERKHLSCRVFIDLLEADLQNSSELELELVR